MANTKLDAQDLSIRRRLTALFGDRSGHKIIRSDMIHLSYMAESGAEVRLTIPTPDLMAAYIKRSIAISPNTLTRRLSVPDYTAPLVVLAHGESFDPATKDQSRKRLLRLRVFEPSRPREICFVEDFPSDDSELAASYYDNGPTLPEFIGILQKAGQDWRAVNFMPPANRPILRLVP